VGSDVGAHVVPEPVVDGEDGAVASQADGDVVVLLARVVGGLQVLATVLDPAHGPAGPYRQQRDQDVFGVHLSPHAEGAAHVGLHEVHAVLGQPHVLGDDAAVDVGHFRHPPHAEHAPPGIPLGQGAARLQRDRRVSLHVERFAQDEVGVAQRALDVAAGDRVRGDHVGAFRLEEDGGSSLGGGPRVHERGKRIVRDLHASQRVLGEVPVVGHDDGHRLADVADLVAGEGTLQVAAHLAALGQTHWDGAIQLGQVAEGDDVDHARARAGGGHVDGPDPRVGVGAPDDGEVKGPETLHVGDEAAAASQQPLVLASLEPLADVGHAPAVARERATQRRRGAGRRCPLSSSPPRRARRRCAGRGRARR
jgi:hypothetical protein